MGRHVTAARAPPIPHKSNLLVSLVTLADLMKDQLIHVKDECAVTGGVKNKLGERIKKMSSLEFHCYHNHIGSMKRTYVDRVIYHEIQIGYRFTMDAFVVSLLLQWSHGHRKTFACFARHL